MMNKSTKNHAQEMSNLFKAQHDMCDLIYRKLFDLMVSTQQKRISISLKDYKIQISADQHEKMLHFYNESRSKNLGAVYFKTKSSFSITEISCPYMKLLLADSTIPDKRPDIYFMWLEEIKKTMTNLLNEDQKYKQISEEIKSLPLFTLPRKVIVEKTE